MTRAGAQSASRSLRFGVMLDLRNPAGWARPPADHVRQQLDLVVRAEDLGADVAWFSEHHFFPDGYLPQPLVLAAAAAVRTTRIRLGTAVVLPALRHEVHLAEEAALVDLLSDGRLELGLGAGWSADEYEAFGADLSRRYSSTDHRTAAVLRLLAGAGVTPGPVQRPVPAWLGYQGPQGARRAGRLGTGLLSLGDALLEPYREGLVEGGHDPGSARMSGLLGIVVSEDPERDTPRLLPHLAHQVSTYRQARRREPQTAAAVNATLDQLTEEYRRTGRVLALAVLTPPDAASAVLDAVHDRPADEVHVWATVGAMPDDLVDSHLRLWLTEVAPRVRAAT